MVRWVQRVRCEDAAIAMLLAQSRGTVILSPALAKDLRFAMGEGKRPWLPGERGYL